MKGAVQFGRALLFIHEEDEEHKNSQLPPPEAATPSTIATRQALECCIWKVRYHRLYLNGYHTNAEYQSRSIAITCPSPLGISVCSMWF